MSVVAGDDRTRSNVRVALRAPETNELRKHLLTVATCSLLAMPTLASSASAATPTTLAGLSPTQILDTSLAAAASRGSATTIGSTTVLGIHLRETTTSGPRSGYGSETINGHRGAVVFLNGVVYAKLDSYLLKLDYGVSDNAEANKWISVTKASKAYAALAAGIAFPSVLREMRPTGVLTTTPLATVDGVATVGVSGAINPSFGVSTGSQTLEVSDVAPFLPVRVVVTTSEAGASATIVLTPKNWGEAVTAVAPKVNTPIARTSLG